MNQDQDKEENGWQSEGESLNTGSASDAQAPGNAGEGKEQKGGIHNNALFAASMGRPATAQVDPHSNSGLAQTGTNTSYEGATAPGAGGSAGSGYTSGQSGVDSSLTSSSDYAQTQTGKTEDGDDAAADNEDDAKNTLI